jgi:hypothetical protein
MRQKLKTEVPARTMILRSLQRIDRLKACADLAEERGLEKARRACNRMILESSIEKCEFEKARELVMELRIGEDDVKCAARRASKARTGNGERIVSIDICKGFGLVREEKELVLESLAREDELAEPNWDIGISDASMRGSERCKSFDYAVGNGMAGMMRDRFIARVSYIISNHLRGICGIIGGAKTKGADELTANDIRIDRAAEEAKEFLGKYGMKSLMGDSAMSAIGSIYRHSKYDFRHAWQFHVMAVARSFGIGRANWDEESRNAIMESLGSIWQGKGWEMARQMCAELGIGNAMRENGMMGHIRFVALAESVRPGNRARTMELAKGMGAGEKDIRKAVEERARRIWKSDGELKSLELARITMEYGKGNKLEEKCARRHAGAAAETAAENSRPETAAGIAAEFGLEKLRERFAKMHVCQLLKGGSYREAEAAAERHGLTEEAAQIGKIASGLGR